MNKLKNLIEYPFTKLKNLLEWSELNFHGKIIDMSLGEPQHPVPKILIESLEKNSRFWNKYPPANGTSEYRQAIVDWFTNRYSLNKKFLDPDLNVLPLSGTREGLYSLAHLAAALYDGQKELIAMADPFYQTYHAAAIMSGSKPLLLTAKEENNFLPQIDTLEENILNKISLFYLCSHTNPQGASADYKYIHKVISLAQRHNLIVAFDECYSEIYLKSPPIGALEVCQKNNLSLKNIIIFNSLSKRSNAAGLRSGFIVGDPNIIFQFSRMRSFGCAGTPIAILNATIDLLEDEKHVKENRELYLEKFIDSEIILKEYSGFNLPDAAIFLWIKVNDAEFTTQRIWSEAGVKVIPGSFFSQKKGEPQTEYIRIAIANNYLTTKEGITRISKILRTQ